MAAEIQRSGFVNGLRIPVISPALILPVFADSQTFSLCPLSPGNVFCVFLLPV